MISTCSIATLALERLLCSLSLWGLDISKSYPPAAAAVDSSVWKPGLEMLYYEVVSLFRLCKRRATTDITIDYGSFLEYIQLVIVIDLKI